MRKTLGLFLVISALILGSCGKSYNLEGKYKITEVSLYTEDNSFSARLKMDGTFELHSDRTFTGQVNLSKYIPDLPPIPFQGKYIIWQPGNRIELQWIEGDYTTAYQFYFTKSFMGSDLESIESRVPDLIGQPATPYKGIEKMIVDQLRLRISLKKE